MATSAQITRINEAFDAAFANADYAELVDVTKAKAFATAVRRLLFIADQAERTGGESVRFDKRFWAEQLKKAEAFLNAQDDVTSRGGIRYFITGGLNRA